MINSASMWSPKSLTLLIIDLRQSSSKIGIMVSKTLCSIGMSVLEYILLHLRVKDRTALTSLYADCFTESLTSLSKPREVRKIIL